MRPRTRSGLNSLLLVSISAALVGCLVGSEIIVKVDRRNHISRLTNTESRDETPIPLLNELTRQDYEVSLRRIIITYIPYLSFTQSEPKPLFSDENLRLLTPVLQQHLPNLKEDERIQFRFVDPYVKEDVLVEIFADGEYLVFDFKALSRDVDAPPDRRVEPRDRSFISPQAGQLLRELQLRSILKEPIRRDRVAIARLLQKKLDMISEAQREKVIDEDEEERLRTIVNENEGVTEIQLEVFLEKRRTLEAALKQKLFTEQDYNAKIESLTRELTQ